MRPALALSVGMVALAACSSGSTTGVEGGCVGNGCSHGTTGRSLTTVAGSASSSGSGSSSGGSSGVASSSGGTSSGGTSGSSSAGSSSGGSSSGGETITCANITGFVWDGGACPTSWYGTRFADLGTCAPIVGATVEALGSNGVPISGGSATTDATGDFAFCLPAGSVYTPFVQAADYPPSYLAQQNGPPPNEWIGLVSTDSLGAVTGLLGGGYDPSRGVVAVFFQSDSACKNQAGWSVTLFLPATGRSRRRAGR